MNKLKKVQKALEEKTKGSDNFITVSTNTDARHNGKYVIRNIVTNSTGSISYKTLDEIIKEYNLSI